MGVKQPKKTGEQGNVTLVALAVVSATIAIAAFQSAQRSKGDLRALKIGQVRNQAVDANVAALMIVQKLMKAPPTTSASIYPDPYIDYSNPARPCPPTKVVGGAANWVKNTALGVSHCVPVLVYTPNLGEMRAAHWSAVMANNFTNVPSMTTTVRGVQAYYDAPPRDRYIKAFDIEAYTSYVFQDVTNIAQNNNNQGRLIEQKTKARLNLLPPPTPSCEVRVAPPFRGSNTANPVYYSFHSNNVITAATLSVRRNGVLVSPPVPIQNVMNVNHVSTTFQLLTNGMVDTLGRYQVTATVQTVDGQTVNCTVPQDLLTFDITCPANGLMYPPMGQGASSYCYYMGTNNQNCNSRCAEAGLRFDAVGSDFLNDANRCPSVLRSLRNGASVGSFQSGFANLCQGCGCKFSTGILGFGFGWYRHFPSTAQSSFQVSYRACGCMK